MQTQAVSVQAKRGMFRRITAIAISTSKELLTG
jgi:hypothetical protein